MGRTGNLEAGMGRGLQGQPLGLSGTPLLRVKSAP